MKYTNALLPLISLSLPVSASVYSDNAATAINLLQSKYYNTATGLYKGETGDLWWQSGNIIETIARFGKIDADFRPTAINIVANTYTKAANRNGAVNWTNKFYDDEGWWALAWIASYDLTGEKKYLDTAKNIFYDMVGGWTTPCGGIWWSKDKTSVNAVANSLLISVAAHLANRVPATEKQEFVDWAQKDWDWFKGTGMINHGNLINDGLRMSDCQNSGKETFTYNQGVVLGALSELARAKSDGGFINRANTLANASTTRLVFNGIVNEPVAYQGEVAGMFKGAYVRGLSTLNNNIHSPTYTEFLKKNADSVWSNARNSEGLIQGLWQGGSSTVNPSTHASGIDVLVAAAAAVGK